MKYSFSQVLAALLISTLALQCSAQQIAPLSKKAAAIKRKAETLKPLAPISVVRINEGEEFGNFVSSDQEAFTFYDVDRKADVTLKYVDVQKIKNGYGGYNSFQKRHTDHTKAIIIVALVLGGLAGLIGAAAAAK